jgi:hypothetical protein
MQLSNHVVTLPFGKEVCIDLKTRNYCLLNFLSGEFKYTPWTSFLHVTVWAYHSEEAMTDKDVSRTYQKTEKIQLGKYSDGKNGLITLNRAFILPHLYKIAIIFQNEYDEVPNEIELSYSVT